MTSQQSQNQEQSLAEKLRIITSYKKGEVIFEEDSRGFEMFIIHSGEVRISRKNPNGEGTTILSVLGPGDMFGEMALIDQEPRSATATANTKATRLVVLDRARFMYYVRYEPEFALIVMETLCQRIREKNAQYSRLLEGI